MAPPLLQRPDMRLRTSLLLHVGPLALLALVAVLFTLPCTTWLDVELAEPAHLTSEPTPPSLGREPARGLDEPRLRALLGLSATATPPPAASASRSPFPARLLGTLSANVREQSMASFLLPSGEVDTVWEGDRVADAEVVSVERGVVTLLRNGALERVELRPAVAGPIPVITPMAANAYRVSRAEVMRRMSDLYTLSREVRIVPAFRDGQPIGFRFAGIAADSSVAQLGLQSGDVIRSVNGQPMQSVQQVLALAASLDRVGEVRIELERSGQPLTHRYQLD